MLSLTAWIHDQRGFLVVFVCKKIGDAHCADFPLDPGWDDGGGKGSHILGSYTVTPQCYSVTPQLQCYTTVTVLHHSVTVLHHPPGYRRHLCSILYCVKQCNGQCVIWWFPHFGQLHQCYTTSLLHCTVTPQASPPPPVLHEPPPPSLQQVTCLQNVVQVPSGKDL